MRWSDLTSPPRAQRTPKSKVPIFSSKFQTTKSFSPGHVVGAGVLALGVLGVTKLFIDRGHAEIDRQRHLGGPGPQLASAPNARGEYGKKP